MKWPIFELWPGESVKGSGHLYQSQTMWNLVVRSSRLRPKAWAMDLCVLLFAASRGGAAGVDRCRIDHTGIQIHQTIVSQAELETGQVGPELAVVALLMKAIADSRPGAIASWQVPPLGARAKDPVGTAQHLAVIAAGKPRSLRW